jgi:hypothetical protein
VVIGFHHLFPNEEELCVCTIKLYDGNGLNVAVSVRYTSGDDKQFLAILVQILTVRWQIKRSSFNLKESEWGFREKRRLDPPRALDKL